jgi:ferritin-like metal-binding protein YciE
MAPNNLDEQLTKYLTDAHSIEQQALTQLKDAPKLAGDAQIASVFEAHERETEGHERLVASRLEERGAKPSKVKDLVGLLTGKGFVIFAATQPDTPGKLIVHAFSYEHLEEATYSLLGKVAVRAGDEATAEVAAKIETEEREMGDRLSGCFDRAAELSVAKLGPSEVSDQLGKYLGDAHAIEVQSVTLLKKSPKLAGTPALAGVYDEHRAQTEGHRRLLEERMRDRGESPSAIKDAALRIGALNWGGFFTAQPDTPPKLAGFAFAVEHLEIGAYEMLRRVAQHAGDEATVALADRILAEEHAAAAKIHSLFDLALDASLEARGVGAR